MPLATATDPAFLDTLSAEDLIYLATNAQSSIKSLEAFVDDLRSRLSTMRDLGLIDDKVACPAGTASFQTRESWAYSPAVKELQHMEQLEGIATKKLSSSWTIRPAKAPQQ